MKIRSILAGAAATVFLQFLCAGEKQSATPTFVYITTAGGVSVYTLDRSTGRLIAVSHSPVAAGATPSAVAMHPSGRFVYVINSESNDVSAYTVSAGTGALQAISGERVLTGKNPNAIAVDPSGRFAYIANAESGDVSSYKINPSTGALIPGPTVQAGDHPAFIAIDPLGKFVYICNEGVAHPLFFAHTVPGNISAYSLNSDTGALTALPGSPFKAGANPSSIAFDPSGKMAYVTDAGTPTIFEVAINQAKGSWTQVRSFPIASGVDPISMKIDPTGQFGYVADSGGRFTSHGTIRSYRIDPSGSLIEIGSTKIIPLEFMHWYHTVHAIAIDPSGTFLVAIDSKDALLAMFRIDTTGALSQTEGSPYKIGDGADSVVISNLH